MILTIDQSKIDNSRTYKEVMIIYSGDNDNKIILPEKSMYRVGLKNKNGVLPFYDFFEGDVYLINEFVYKILGKSTLEFIKINGSTETSLLLNIDVKVSVQNMEINSFGEQYIFELEKATNEVINKINKINDKIDEKYNDLKEIDFKIKNNDLYIIRKEDKLNGRKKFR